MRLATRTLLWSFLPFAALLLGSFWSIQKMVVASVRDGLRSSLRQTQTSMARAHARSELQNSRFLSMVAENAALKAGIQLLLQDPGSGDARRTVEEQLREICESLNFDFLLASGLDGRAMAGVMRSAGQFGPMDLTRLRPPRHGFFSTDQRTYQVTTVPVDQADENLAALSVGERFDFSEFNIPAVLTRCGKVIESSVPGIPARQLQAALLSCRPGAECEIRLAGQTYLSLPLEMASVGAAGAGDETGAGYEKGYLLRGLQNMDAASGPMQAILRKVFLFAGLAALLAAFMIAAVSSRSIVRPIDAIVSQLRAGARTGVLPEFRPDRAPIQEMRELMQSFNRAAAGIREGRENLHRAYVEFVGSLASALDARDRYTAGHSRRVSEWSCAAARAIGIAPAQIDEIRIGALLHDIGKIGIADSVLQNAGKLTAEEFALIQTHPTIGRRILEGVHGFELYLPVVELHHENWDGTGYPFGLSGEAVPLSARIVHVIDAYDAMTSDRPYRAGMSHEEAIAILERFSGTQFDPAAVEAFTGLHPSAEKQENAEEPSLESLWRTLARQHVAERPATV